MAPELGGHAGVAAGVRAGFVRMLFGCKTQIQDKVL
jgi:hypothetical protein